MQTRDKILHAFFSKKGDFDFPFVTVSACGTHLFGDARVHAMDADVVGVRLGVHNPQLGAHNLLETAVREKQVLR